MNNTSGIYPVEYKVLIRPEKVEEKTKGGIILPETAREKEKYNVTEGTLIAVSPNAFTDPDWLDPPKVGARVLYDRFAGSTVKGKDGEDYRLINDKEIGAIIHGD